MRPFRQLLVLSAISCIPTGAAAQISPDSAIALHKRQCISADSLIRFGSANDSDYVPALMIVRSCDHVLDLFGTIWQKAVPEHARIIYSITREMRDLRAYNAVAAAVSDASRPRRVRLAALGSLAAFMDPTLLLQLTDSALLPTEIHAHRFSKAWGRINHGVLLEGEEPLPANWEAMIHAQIEDLRADADSVVQFTATQLRIWLQGVSPPGFDPSQVTVRYVCANTFGIDVNSPAGAVLRYELTNGRDSGVIMPAGRQPSSDANEHYLIVQNRGTLRISFRGQLLAQVRNMNKSCQ